MFYQHPWLTRGGDPDWQVAGAVILLAAISFLALRQVRRRPYLTVGWLWYLGTLIPVIGLVQIGSQSMADKYTYVPLIGLFVVIAWGGSEVLASLRTPTKVAAALAVTILGSSRGGIMVPGCALAEQCHLVHTRSTGHGAS